jgi:glycosyltransferase involved in cell wall biosynthesis
MRVSVVSFKECWQDSTGAWWSYGGFPLQMSAIASLFDEATLLICRGRSRPGGSLLPRHATVVPMRLPVGSDLRRKLDVLLHMPYYVRTIVRGCAGAEFVHVPPPGDLPLIGMVVALAMRKPLLVRYGGSWANTVRTTLANRATRWLMRRFAGGRNVMLATGEGMSAPAPGMRWIFSTALSCGELQEITPRLDRGLASPPRLIYAGRLSPEKGVADLVRAHARLTGEGFAPLPLVTVAGDGPERARLEALVAELGCGDRVHFVGQLDRPSLSRYMSQADVCVQPSLSEGFSKAWLDAFAHALPVLSSDVGAARAVIGENGERGWLVPPGDVSALTRALRAVLTEPIAWSSLRARCCAYVEGRTLEEWAKRIGEFCAQQWGVRMVGGKLVA